MNELDLYVNKKFDILKIIKMVLKRQAWGEVYTLYSTPTHEVLAVMSSYNFEDKYATFKIKVNEKKGSGYCSDFLNIFTDREDYTLTFVNKLLLRSIIRLLKNYRRSVFENEANNLYPFIFLCEKSNEEWIEQFNLQDKVNKIKLSQSEEEEKEEFIGLLINKYLSKYKDEFCYKPRDKYVNAMLASEKEPQVLSLIKEVEEELEKLKDE